jgi:hypothetical protein
MLTWRQDDHCFYLQVNFNKKRFIISIKLLCSKIECRLKPLDIRMNTRIRLCGPMSNNIFTTNYKCINENR